MWPVGEFHCEERTMMFEPTRTENEARVPLHNFCIRFEFEGREFLRCKNFGADSGDVDGFDVGEFADAEGAHFTAVTGFFDSAERQTGIRFYEGVYKAVP